MSDFYTMVDGQQQGPYTDEQLQNLASQGKISPSTLVWSEGFDEWVPASDLDGIDWTRKKLMLSHGNAAGQPQPSLPSHINAPSANPFQQNQYGQESNVFFNPDPPVSIGDWMVTFLLSSIPVVNFVMFFVWAFSDNTKKSKSNWSKAVLIYSLIGILIWIPLIFF